MILRYVHTEISDFSPNRSFSGYATLFTHVKKNEYWKIGEILAADTLQFVIFSVVMCKKLSRGRMKNAFQLVLPEGRRICRPITAFTGCLLLSLLLPLLFPPPSLIKFCLSHEKSPSFQQAKNALCV